MRINLEESNVRNSYTNDEITLLTSRSGKKPPLPNLSPRPKEYHKQQSSPIAFNRYGLASNRTSNPKKNVPSTPFCLSRLLLPGKQGSGPYALARHSYSPKQQKFLLNVKRSSSMQSIKEVPASYRSSEHSTYNNRYHQSKSSVNLGPSQALGRNEMFHANS